MILNALLNAMPFVDHVTVPAETLIVSPGEAFETQVLKLAWSGVEVHFGLLPVHCARKKNGNNNRISAPRSVLIAGPYPHKQLSGKIK